MTQTVEKPVAEKGVSAQARKPRKQYRIEDFYFLKIGNMWRYMKTQHFSFWMICFYIFFEYTRPQAIFPVIDFLPWAQVFILLSMIGAVLDPTVRWVSSPVNWVINLFALLIFISSIYAFDPALSESHYIDFYSWYVVYYLIINIVNTKERLYVFMMVMVISMAKIAIGTAKSWVMRGFSFTSWGLMGPAGYFQNSGELSILMLTLFPLAYYLYEYLKNRVSIWERYLLIAFWVAPIMTILGASSRGAQVALVVQLLIMFRKKVFKPKQMIVIGLMVFALYSLLPEEQKARFESAGDDKTSQQRLLYWKHGLEMIQNHPWLGVGFFNFPVYYENYFQDDMLYDRAQLPHNIFIQVGTDAGILAMILAALLVCAPYFLYRNVRQRLDKGYLKVVSAGTGMGLLGFVIAGQFVTVFYYPFLWIGLGVAVATEHITGAVKRIS